MKRVSIRRRLLLAYGLVLAVIILLFGSALVWGLGHSFYAQLRSALESVAFDIKHDVLTASPAAEGVLDPTKEYAVSPVYIEVWEMGESPRRILASANLRTDRLPLLRGVRETFELQRLPFISRDEKSALLSVPATVGAAHYRIAVATPVDSLDDVIEDFIESFVLYGALLYLAALYLGYRLIDRVLAPMRSITESAATISHGDLSRRVPLPAVRDEFYTLAETFNGMLERIGHGFEKMQRFNANVSHELKTPLTIIRGEAEVALMRKRDPEAYETALRSMMEETLSMQRIIDGMLLLSRSDQDALMKNMVPVRLDAVLQEVYERYRGVAEAKGVGITITHTEAVEIMAEPQLIKEVFVNLADNAVKYTPKGRNVTMEMRESDGKALVRIADEGIGIDEVHLSKLFDPFWREDAAHGKTIPGHGLGLSIVQWIVQVHQGIIEIESVKNRGTVCLLRFDISSGRSIG